MRARADRKARGVRTSCFGTCPRYRITVAGSGAVRFRPIDRSSLKEDQVDSIPPVNTYSTQKTRPFSDSGSERAKRRTPPGVPISN